MTVGNTVPAQFGRVVAKAKGLTAYARIRVAPIAPYTADFAKVPVGRTPGGWVNCQGKFSVVKMADGTAALKKRNNAPSPLVARAHAYIGLPSLTGYTIQSDVQGTQGQEGFAGHGRRGQPLQSRDDRQHPGVAAELVGRAAADR